MRSRRMPWQVTTISSLPKLSIAICTIRSPALHGGYGLVAGQSLATGFADEVHRLVGLGDVLTGAVDVHAGVDHYHSGPLVGHETGDTLSDAPSGAGHDC